MICRSLTHCRFSFGKIASEDPLTGNGGAIYVKAYNKVSISHCIFQDNFATYNGGAIYLDSADIVIHNSIFTRNRCGLAVAPWGYGGAISSDNSSPDIRWNVFAGNSSTGVGGAFQSGMKTAIFTTIFLQAISVRWVGPWAYCTSRKSITGSIITCCREFCAFFSAAAWPTSMQARSISITRSFITGNLWRGILLQGLHLSRFLQYDFLGKYAAVGPQGYLFEVYSQADFFNCDVEGGPDLFGGSGGGEAFFGAYEQCLDTDPEFVGSGEYPYVLSLDSPCY